MVVYIVNNMNPDQTAPLGAVWSGFIVFASLIKVIQNQCYAADVISRQYFQDDKILAR